jgi:RHS repeat-associated protein
MSQHTLMSHIKSLVAPSIRLITTVISADPLRIFSEMKSTQTPISRTGTCWKARNKMMKLVNALIVVGFIAFLQSFAMADYQDFYAKSSSGHLRKFGLDYSSVHDASTADYAKSGLQSAVGCYRIGSDLGYNIHRIFLIFDTSTLPDNATITGAELQIYPSMAYFPGYSLYLVESQQRSTSSLSVTDFGKIGSFAHGSLSSGSVNTGRYNTIQIGNSDTVSKYSYTKYGLRLSPDVDQTPPGVDTGYLIWINDSSNSNPPFLRVYYDEQVSETIIISAPFRNQIVDRNQTSSVNVRWSEITGASSYELTLNNDASTAQEYRKIIFGSTSHTIYLNDSIPNNVYTLTLNANIGTTQTQPSTVRFTIDSSPPSPTITSPSDGTIMGASDSFICTVRNPFHPWNSYSEADVFHLELDDNQYFNSPIRRSVNVTPNTYVDLYFSLDEMLADGTYYARVTAQKSWYSQWSDFSNVISFTVDEQQTPVPTPTPTPTATQPPTPTITPTPSPTPTPTETPICSESTNGGSEGNQSQYHCDPVNLSTGNYFFSKTLLTVPSWGFPFRFTVSANIIDREHGQLGWCWRHSYQVNIIENTDPANTVDIVWGDGRVDRYEDTGLGSYSPLWGGYRGDLTKTSNLYQFQNKNGLIYQFNENNTLSYIENKDGNRLSLTYEDGVSEKRIQKITETAGREYTFTYYPGSDHLYTLTDPLDDPAPRTWTFEYDNEDLSKIILPQRDGFDPEFYQFGYDEFHRIETMTDKRGILWLTNSYDDQDRVDHQEMPGTEDDSQLRVFEIDYDDEQHLTTVTDPDGNQQSYSHDLNHSFRGDSIGYEKNYDLNNKVTESTSPMGRSTSYTYDSNGNRLSTKDSMDRLVNETEYNEINRPTKWTDAHGIETSTEYSPEGKMTAFHSPSGTTRWLYGVHGEVLCTTNTLSLQTDYGYNSNGDQDYTKLPDGTEHHRVYDNIGRLRFVKDKDGNVLRELRYDAHNHVVKQITPLGETEQRYDANGNVIAQKSMRGYWSYSAYDVHDNVTCTTDTLGNATHYKYDKFNRLRETILPRGGRLYQERDEFGNVILSVDANDNPTTTTYNNDFQPIAVTNGNNHTWSTQYNSVGQAVAQTDPAGNSYISIFDVKGQVVESIDPNTHSSTHEYNDSGFEVKTIDAEGNEVENFYDSEGNLIKIKDGNGNFRYYGYEKNLLTAWGDGVSTTTLSYIEGKPHIQTNPDGTTRTNIYDDYDRLTDINYSNSTPNVHFDYFSDGVIDLITIDGNSTDFEWDPRGQLDTITDIYGNLVDYTWDEDGNLKMITYPDGKQVEYIRDLGGRITQIEAWFGTVATYQYDGANNTTQIDYGNGTIENRTYDRAERLIGISHKKSDDSTIWKNSIVLDGVGNHLGHDIEGLVDRQLTRQNIDYTYTPGDQLIDAIDEFGPDIDPTFDINGNMVQMVYDGITWTMDYDAEHRLVSLLSDAGYSASYILDGQGDRIKATRNGIEIRYVLDKNTPLERVLCETDSSNAIQTYYIYSDEGLVGSVNQSGDVLYYHGDHLGSTVALSDETESIVQAYAYDEYGQIQGQLSDYEQPFCFVGRHGIMQETDWLLFMRARYYDVRTGRFLQKDPARQFTSPYLYGHPNPLITIDPDGKFIRFGAKFFGTSALFDRNGLLSSGRWLNALELDLSSGTGGARMEVAERGLAGGAQAGIYLQWFDDDYLFEEKDTAEYSFEFGNNINFEIPEGKVLPRLKGLSIETSKVPILNRLPVNINLSWKFGESFIFNPNFGYSITAPITVVRKQTYLPLLREEGPIPSPAIKRYNSNSGYIGYSCRSK